MLVVRAVLVVMFAKHHIVLLLVISCFTFLGCSLPLTVNDDFQGVSGGVVPAPTNSQRAMSFFESNRADQAVDEGPDDSDVISTADGAGSSDSFRDDQTVSPTRFSPLIP